MKITRSIPALALVILIFGCSNSESNRSENQVENEQQLIEVNDLYQQCDDTLFAAIYYHPTTRSLYNDPSRWSGQPVNAFYDLLSDERKETLLLELHGIISSESNEDSATELSNQLSKWCEVASNIAHAETDLSREELLAELYESDRFNYLFLEFSDRTQFQNDELSPLDKVASLSSAESSNVISTLITDLSMSRSSSFDDELNKLSDLLF